MEKIYETNLFEPVKEYLESFGYTINAEVKDCDVTAVKDDEIVIVELKKIMNLSLVYQVIERKKITHFVYAAIPIEEMKKKDFKKFLNLMKTLEVGLMLVNLNSKINKIKILNYPKIVERRKNNKKRAILISEIEKRSGNFNIGGSTRKTIVTAYREEVLLIACILFEKPLSIKEIKEKSENTKTSSILNKNYYNWFEKVERGIYKLNENGYEAIKTYKDITDKIFENLNLS